MAKDKVIETFWDMKYIKIDTDQIKDWSSFHNIFKETFGFPDFYGGNMDAWIDCMTDLDAPDHKMIKIHVNKEEVLVIELLHTESFKNRCPEIYNTLLECIAFVNYRRIESGSDAVLTMSFSG